MDRYRILSLDGGPSVVIQARMLREMERCRPGFLARTNLFAGTSDGAILALYLAKRVTDDDRHNMKVLEEPIRPVVSAS